MLKLGLRCAFRKGIQAKQEDLRQCCRPQPFHRPQVDLLADELREEETEPNGQLAVRKRAIVVPSIVLLKNVTRSKREVRCYDHRRARRILFPAAAKVRHDLRRKLGNWGRQASIDEDGRSCAHRFRPPSQSGLAKSLATAVKFDQLRPTAAKVS